MCGTEQDEDREGGMEGEDIQDVQSEESLWQDRRRVGGSTGGDQAREAREDSNDIPWDASEV